MRGQVLLILAMTTSVAAATQIVYFNPPVGGITSCAIAYLSYRDSVLRLDTNECRSDRVFINGFEGSTDTERGCVGGMCP